MRLLQSCGRGWLSPTWPTFSQALWICTNLLTKFILTKHLQVNRLTINFLVCFDFFKWVVTIYVLHFSNSFKLILSFHKFQITLAMHFYIFKKWGYTVFTFLHNIQIKRTCKHIRELKTRTFSTICLATNNSVKI